MGHYLMKGILPGDEFDELIKLEAKNFVVNDGRLLSTGTRWCGGGLPGMVVPSGLHPAYAQ